MKASELLLQSAEPFDKACMMVREMELEIDRLRAAIQQTLDENGHLADGDNCTLIVLKRALPDYEKEE